MVKKRKGSNGTVVIDLTEGKPVPSHKSSNLSLNKSAGSKASKSLQIVEKRLEVDCDKLNEMLACANASMSLM